jgi:hypothetical protein
MGSTVIGGYVSTTLPGGGIKQTTATPSVGREALAAIDRNPHGLSAKPFKLRSHGLLCVTRLCVEPYNRLLYSSRHASSERSVGRFAAPIRRR